MKDDDFITGENGNDFLVGNDGNDSIIGGEGDDFLLGNQGDDTLDGGIGDDVLSGGMGDDILLGAMGNDTLWGKEGSDIFMIELDRGQDLISDFTDGIDLFGLTNSLGFSDLSITDNAAGKATLIRDPTNNNQLLAIVNNVSPTDITVEDFTEI